MVEIISHKNNYKNHIFEICIDKLEMNYKLVLTYSKKLPKKKVYKKKLKKILKINFKKLSFQNFR